MIVDQPSSYIDHMLKQTRNHHVQLSSMVDIKANILMTAASVIITLSFRYVMEPNLKWGVIILIIFCFLTILLAVYAVMPKVPFFLKPKTKPDIHSNQFNILFFGDFLQLSYNEYEKNMLGILNDPTQSYQAQLREIYNLGNFLADKKYRYVRLAYFSFLIGIFSSGVVILLHLL